MRLWRLSLVACAILSVLSAAQISLKGGLEGVPSSLLGQLGLNTVAWLPWTLLGMVVLQLVSRLDARHESWVRSLLVHVPLGHGVTACYLTYLALFRFAFFPEHTGELSWIGFGQQLARETSDFYVPCLLFYASIAGLGSRFGRPAITHVEASAVGEAPAPAAARSAPTPQAPRRLTISSSGASSYVDVERIDWIQAAGSYARVHMGTEYKLIRRTLTSLERELAGAGFERVHRSRIVNLARVAELRSETHGDATVIYADGRELGVSRSYRARLRSALEAQHRD